MLSEQKNQKKMLLEQFYNISLQIGELISKREIDEVSRLISRKDKIINSISLFKDVQDISFNELAQKIKIQEEKNIETAKSIKSEISQELERLNKNAKISGIYGNSAQKGSIVDITE